MKNAILLLAACAFTTASFAQTPTTEVKTRDNGTKKIVTEHGNTKTVTKTGKTNQSDQFTGLAGPVSKKNSSDRNFFQTGYETDRSVLCENPMFHDR